MMARSEAWLRVTSSAAVVSYRYPYDARTYNNASAKGKSRIGCLDSHSTKGYPTFVNVSGGGVKGNLAGQGNQLKHPRGAHELWIYPSIRSNNTGSIMNSKELMVSTARRITGSETG